MTRTAPPRDRPAAGPPIVSGQADRPLFRADWVDVLFVHYAVEPQVLRRQVPLELDLFDGRAYMSLVAFTQEGLRPRAGGRAAALLSRPLASHPFLNLRTYVRYGLESGIYFLREWIPNRLAAAVGPPLYGLPYRLGRLSYDPPDARGITSREVAAGGKRLILRGEIGTQDPLSSAEPGTLDAFLIERYTAFTCRRGVGRRFRVGHAPWPQQPAIVQVHRGDLLADLEIDWSSPTCAHYSPGVGEVWLSGPDTLPRGAFLTRTARPPTVKYCKLQIANCKLSARVGRPRLPPTEDDFVDRSDSAATLSSRHFAICNSHFAICNAFARGPPFCCSLSWQSCSVDRCRDGGGCG